MDKNIQNCIDSIKQLSNFQICKSVKIANKESKNRVSKISNTYKEMEGDVRNKKELFVRIPLENIEFEDSYEQTKFEEMILTEPDKSVKYLEEILGNTVMKISFHH